jgi:transmembrane sensor
MAEVSPASERDAAIRAEAAAWLARIRSDDGDRRDIAGFQTWLDEDVRHQHAFDSISEIWDAVGGLERFDRLAERRPRRAPRKRAANLARIAVALVVASIAAWAVLLQPEPPQIYATEIGEQRRLALADGSSAILDTATSIRVDYHESRRAIELLRGRAHFDVAADPIRPFVVSTSRRQVVALGTAFDVERSETSLAVTLLRGRIAILPAAKSPDLQPLDLTTPGEHVVFSGAALVRKERRDLYAATAWQSGRAVFNDRSVAQAIAEMNRYSRRPIVVADESVARMRISGTYDIGDTDAFATSLAALLPIRVTREPGRIVLRDMPARQQ